MIAEVFDLPAIAEQMQEIAAADLATFVESQLAYHSVGTMTEDERRRFILGLCAAMRIVPIGTELPIDIIPVEERGETREKLYFRRGATDQLAANHAISFQTVQRPTEEVLGGVHVIVAIERAVLPTGRGLEDIGVVPMPMRQRGQTDEQYVLDVANAMMHAKTKARRRAVLSLLGIPFVDESELHTMRVRRAPPANSQFANRETPDAAPDGPAASEPEPTPLERLRDSLSQIEGALALEQALAIWFDHKREIPVEDGGRASDMVRERLAVPMSSSAWSRAIALAAQCEKSIELRAIRNALAQCTTPAELVRVWDALAPDLASLAAVDAYSHHFAKNEVLFEAVRRIDPGVSQPNVWMKKARAAVRENEVVAATAPDEKPTTGEKPAAPRTEPAPTTTGPVMKFHTRAQRF